TWAAIGAPYYSAYCASKAGLAAFTRVLAVEWAPFNICVNAIGPGDTKTEMTAPLWTNPETEKSFVEAMPQKRWGEPREIALLALYLASEASNFMTGQTIYLDGGQLARGSPPI
ncbi:SDR family NAD(P)-dependent oxidoreductase, partial [Chloroflexota bacterium]